MAQDHDAAVGVQLTSITRACARHPRAGYPDLLASLATAGQKDSAGLLTWVRSGERDSVSGWDSTYLAGFAHALAGMALDDIGVEDIALTLTAAHDHSGGQGLAPTFRDLWLDALHLTGAADRYPYRRFEDVEHRHWRVHVDELNPFGSGETGDDEPAHWLAELSRAFTDYGLAGVQLQPGTAEPLQRLTTTTTSSIGDGPLVSVVIPAFDPEEGPPFSVTSITEQSWTNVEVLVCDDGSSPQGAEILSEWAASDPRVRVVRSERNGGAYAAMNNGIAHARGEFVTFQGSDDWSHPQRIERQVSALHENPEAMGTLSRMARVDDQLALTVLGYAAIGVNASSLLFRRAPVLQRLGGMDTVRRAGDNEFVGRIRAVFGPDAVPVLPEILALVRRTAGSLSRSDMRLLFRHPARAHYRAGYRRWHEHIATGRASGWVPPPQRAPVPAMSRISGLPDVGVPSVDVAILGSMARNAPATVDMAAEVSAVSGTGMRVGVVDLPAPFDLSVPPRPPDGTLLDSVTAGEVAWLLPEEEWLAGLAVIKDPAALPHLGSTLARARVATTLLVADYSPAGKYDAVAVEEILADTWGVQAWWLPATDAVAEELAGSIDPSRLLRPRLWGVTAALSATTWRTEPQPVVGMTAPSALLSADELSRWERKNVPADPRTRVWVRGRAGRSAPLLRPVSSVGRRQLSDAAYLAALSYLVVPPTPGRGPHLDPLILSALQHGCVVLLDPGYRGHFGDAALYTDERGPDQWIEDHAAQPAAYRAQQQRGRRFLTTQVSSHAVAGSVSAILGARSETVAHAAR